MTDVMESTDEAVLRAARDQLLKANLQHLRLLERLEYRDAERLMAQQLAEAAAEAQRSLPLLKKWEALPDRSYAVYSRGANHVRIRRLLDFVAPRERILDIGTGYGYVTSMVLRERAVDYYCGVDLHERYLDAVRQGLATNGLEHRRVHLQTLNLYDLDRAFVEEHRPTLMVVLEVLEHLPDVGRAFKTMAAALDEGTDLLFTVPMNRRIETVWGHRSVFDAARIHRLCADAGLTIHMLEPLQNTWTLVLASRSERIPGRLALAAASAAPVSVPPLSSQYRFLAVGLRQPVPGAEVSDEGLALKVPAGGGRARVTLPLTRPQIVRLDATFQSPESVHEVRLEALDEDGAPVAGWTLSAASGAIPTRRFTEVLRAGEPAGGWAALPEPVVSRGKCLRITVDATGPEPAGLTLHRLDYVPGRT